MKSLPVKTNNSLTLTIVLLLVVQFVIAQTKSENKIQGIISIDFVPVEGVNVLNSSTYEATISDKNGLFNLHVKEGDVLIFSAVNLEILKKIISSQDLISEFMQIKMTNKDNQLKEVIINEYPEINAVSLGISPSGIKKYTPAERKLATASFGRLNPMGLDPLLNLFSGRTAMLKKELIVERKEQLLAYLGVLFEDKYYTETLKIPSIYIKGFQYYSVEDMNFAKSLKSKNKTLIMFLIAPLAEKYKQIIANEN